MRSWSKSFWLLAFIVLLGDLFKVSSLNGVNLYAGTSPLGADERRRISANNRELSSDAHVLGAGIKILSNKTLLLTINLRHLPFHVNINTSIMEELFVNFANHNGDISDQYLWFEDNSTKTPLARVSLETSKTGYQTVSLRKTVASWLKNHQATGILRLKLTPGAITASKLMTANASPFVVIYTHSRNAALLTSPKVACESYNISLSVSGHGDIIFPTEVGTKICSTLDVMTFPFNGSSVFDVGKAVMEYLKRNPLPSNSPMLRNPPCCHAVQSLSMSFLTSGGVVRLKNTRITECGCKDF